MTNDTPTFSLVYLTWNAENIIMDTLSSAFDQEYQNYEVVVVDNNSQDATIPIIEDRFGDEPTLRVVGNDENLGFSRGINRGIVATKGDYICCYNHDTLLSDGYLSTLERHVTQDAVWTTARINHRVSDSQRCVRLLGVTRFTIPYVVDGLSGTVPTNFVPGDGVIVPRRVFADVLDEQIFDPTLPPRGEDIALSLQLRSNDVPLRAIVDTYSIHPDKGDRYAPTPENLKEFMETFRARLIANRMYDSSTRSLVLTMFSIIAQPVSVYIGSFPRCEQEFLHAIDRLKGDKHKNKVW